MLENIKSLFRQHIKPSIYAEPTEEEMHIMAIMADFIDAIDYIPPDMDIIKSIRDRMPHYCTYGVGNYPHIEWVYAYILLHDGITLEGLQRMKDRLLALKAQRDADIAKEAEANNAQTKQALLRMVGEHTKR